MGASIEPCTRVKQEYLSYEYEEENFDEIELFQSDLVADQHPQGLSRVQNLASTQGPGANSRIITCSNVPLGGLQISDPVRTNSIKLLKRVSRFTPRGYIESIRALRPPFV